MKTLLRLPRSVFSSMVENLARPHEVAGERVGFLHAKYAQPTEDDAVLLGYEFYSVADHHYFDGPAAACINGDAIRIAMQRALEDQCCVLHVHLHDHRGRPGFSPIDRRTLNDLTPSFQQVAENVPHGGLVLSRNMAHGLVWLPGAVAPVSPSITIVGFPIALLGGTRVNG